MNSLTDPGVAELLERLHREADAQTPELRKRVTAIGKSEQTPEAWFQELSERGGLGPEPLSSTRVK